MWRQLKSLTRILQPAIFAQQKSINSINNSLRSFSVFSSNMIERNVTAVPAASNCSLLTTSLLQPSSVALNFDRGMKQMGRLKRRCKDCYFVMRQERLYVMCKTHGRHKQMQMKKKPKNTWILTDATQSKLRAW
jgi:large subunit ribosomal protein L36